jgi:hypothetical protein
MALDPQSKEVLTKFSMVAKKIIYDPERMKQFMQMLGSTQGALAAVQTVMAVIEKQRPIPPEIAPYLGVNIYMIMVDVAQEVTQHKPSPEIIKGVIETIMKTVQQSHGQQQAAPAQSPPQGIIGSQMQGAPA